MHARRAIETPRDMTACTILAGIVANPAMSSQSDRSSWPTSAGPASSGGSVSGDGGLSSTRD